MTRRSCSGGRCTTAAKSGFVAVDMSNRSRGPENSQLACSSQKFQFVVINLIGCLRRDLQLPNRPDTRQLRRRRPSQSIASVSSAAFRTTPFGRERQRGVAGADDRSARRVVRHRRLLTAVADGAEQAPYRLGARPRFPIGGAPVTVVPRRRRRGPGRGRLLQRPTDAAVGRCRRDDSSSSEGAVGVSSNPASTRPSFRGRAGPSHRPLTALGRRSAAARATGEMRDKWSSTAPRPAFVSARARGASAVVVTPSVPWGAAPRRREPRSWLL